MVTEDRYDRQKTIWNQEKLEKSKVLVVGAGTLGNEICKNLALVGVGHITVIDMDTIEEVNLNRCLFFRESDIGKPKSEVLASRISELNPQIGARGMACDINIELGAGLFLEFDVILGGLDNIMARERINKYAYWTGTPYIDGAIEGLNGQIQVIIPPHTACYSCSVPPQMQVMRNVHMSCSGTKLDSEGMSVPMVATTASIIGALEVQEALNIIHTHDSELKGKQLRFDQAHSYREDMPDRKPSPVHYDLYENEVVKRDDCPYHTYYRDSLLTITLSEDSYLQELYEAVETHVGKGAEIRNDEMICYRLFCTNCGWEKSMLQLKKAIGEDVNTMACPECGKKSVLDDSDDLLRPECYSKKINELGIPQKQILLVNREIPIIVDKENITLEKKR